MGNINSTAKFDIISNLPRELVAIIICHLNQRDVANCLLVSHSWNDIIRNLAPYWWSAIERHIGLSREAIVRSAASFSTPKALFIAAKKYKSQVGSNKLRSSPVDYFPAMDLQFTLCMEAKEMMIVRSQKLKENSVDSMLNQNCQYGILVERVNQFTSQDCGTELEIEPVATFPLVNDASVAWAHVAGDNVYWVTRHGIWRGINYKSQEEIFSWKNNLLNNGCGVTVACCKDCSMLVASQWMTLSEGDSTNNKSAYALQVVSLASTKEKVKEEEEEEGEKIGGKPRELVSWKIFKANHSHPLCLHHDSRYWIRETLITSKSHSGRQKTGTLCHKHTLVVQSDRCTVLHTIEVENTNNVISAQATKGLQQDVHIRIGAGECINCTYNLKYSDESGGQNKHTYNTRNISSAVNISSDESLLGMVFKKELHVWKFLLDSVTGNTKNTAATGLELTSKASLKSKSESSTGTGGASNSITLVALGHNLSIVAYRNDTYVMDYRVNVVMTHTGEILMEFRRIERFYDWSLCCQVDPLHKFYFMMLDEEWLNTIEPNGPIPTTPMVTLHNHHGRLHTEAIQCYKPEQTRRKHSKCFMQ